MQTPINTISNTLKLVLLFVFWFVNSVLGSYKVARDAYGYNLYYYNTDYAPIITTNLPFATTLQTGSYLRQLYNGNIAGASVNIPQLTSSAYWLDKVYTYDQLNRIKSATAYHTVSTSSTPVHNGDYDETFTYDGNGNILTVNRAGSGTGTLKDVESYTYNRRSNGQLINNQLNYLNGHAGASNITPDQAVNNYTYDQIGNLTADVQAGITAIGWSVYGKITNINKAAGKITYTYNPAGERVSKTFADLTTYYIRDAQGNTLALYDNKSSAINWREQHLYGSNRIGMWTPNVNLSTGSSLGVWDTVGRKQYELTNHLGNVLATLTDKRLQHTTSGTSIDYYNADVATAQDYYAFGSLQPGRQYNFSNVYRYGFNGKENDNEVRGIGNQQDYGQRININWVGRFSSVDPINRQYPELSSYQFAGNNPILNIDVDGLEPERLHSDDPITEFFNDIVYKFQSKVYKFEAGVSKMSDQQIKNGINKTAASILRNPVKVVDNAIKDIDKQGHQVPKDLKTFSHLVANGETKNARDFAENKIVEYGPWALFFDEKEVEAMAPKLFEDEAKASANAVELKPYGGSGGGHHVLAKKAFEGAPGYNANKALAIPNAELARLNISHALVTGAQMVGYKAFAATGYNLTWDAVAIIETVALKKVGMEAAAAQKTVNEAINDLIKSGVTKPTKIPWGGN